MDSMGRPLTQSLFLEIGYNEDAVYSLKEVDHFHNGRVYPSLKRLFLLTSDPTEYKFATTYLLGWKHWMRLCENKILKTHITEWREELEIKLRSEGVYQVMQASQGGSWQAAKWLADRGWDQRGAGRPTDEEKAKHLKIQEKIDNEYAGDIIRMVK